MIQRQIAHRQLRILFLLNAPWSANLGGPRVMVELAEEFRKLGHHVEKYSYEDAFPDTTSQSPANRGGIGRLVSIARSYRNFGRRAARYVRARALAFDVVDACQPDLGYSKESLGFRGLLVTRSVMFLPAYEAFAKAERVRSPIRIVAKQRIVGALTFLGRRGQHKRSRKSFRFADLVNVSSADDYAALDGDERYSGKVVRFPFGMSAARRDAFARQRAIPRDRLEAQTVAFIGTWNSRKGSRDWPEIASRLRSLIPSVRFQFLGTGIRTSEVLRAFPAELRDAIDVLPKFESEDLPSLLARASVGAFPGYLESFGFTVLEKLAAGLPLVAYEAPGTRDITSHLGYFRRIEAGDIESLVEELYELLRSDAERYARLAAESTRVAGMFRWEDIAKETCEIYLRRIEELRRI